MTHTFSTVRCLALFAAIAMAVAMAMPAATAASPQGPGGSKVAHVFVLAGQSNMEGVGRVSEHPAAARVAANGFLFHSRSVGVRGQDNKWLPLCPAGWQGIPGGSFGVEMALGPDLARQTGQPIYLIKHAVGGTSLARGWDPIGGKQYAALDALMQRAFAGLRAQGLKPVVRGIFWQQGEADAKDVDQAHAYASRLENLVVRLRARLVALGVCATPTAARFVLGQVLPKAEPANKKHARYPYRSVVRAAQMRLPEALRNVACVATNAEYTTHADDRDGYRDGDTVHFDGAGLLKLGHAMAEAYQSAGRDDAAMAQGAMAQGAMTQEAVAQEHVQDQSPQRGADAATLRVISYNTFYIFNKSTQIVAASRWLGHRAPDIVALQELTNTTADKLREMAAGWRHEHSALLKESGFSVGITSRLPIEVLDRLTGPELHHGCLHVRIDGVHIFVVHLSPFEWRKRTTESAHILKCVKPLLEQGKEVLVLGDFNASSAADQELLLAQPKLLARLQDSDAKHGHIENLRDQRIDYSVMSQFFAAGLHDVALPYLEQARDRRWTFPTGLLGTESRTPPAHGRRIDFVLGSARLAERTVHASVARRGAVNRVSDHYPVVVEFRRGM
ncbi:MAG: sialate O-acetylesterase [Planctomycetota bacterium]